VARTEHEAIVVGGGAAGLSAAAMLQRAGVPALVLERERIGESWRRRYDRLHLHTHRLFSSMPGYRFSARRGPWVAKDDVVDYLEGYARHHALEVRTGIETTLIERADGGWRVETSAGAFEAPFVVVATGYEREPFMPDWPGRDSFEGELVHGSEYRNPQPYAGREVLVVGSGNTGAEIAVDLHEGGASSVWISIRTPPQVFLRDVGGLPSQAGSILLHRLPSAVADPVMRAMQRTSVGDLRPFGMPRPERGPLSDFRLRNVVPILDVGLVRLLKKGLVSVVPAVEGFEGPRVLLAGGESLRPDAVIAATGYRCGLEPLVGHLGVLGPDGCPRQSGGRTDPAAAGLHFIGYLNPLSGRLWSMQFESRRVARAVAGARAGRTAA
jgi:putative flavoprotein involved in K+ transport